MRPVAATKEVNSTSKLEVREEADGSHPAARVAGLILGPMAAIALYFLLGDFGPRGDEGGLSSDGCAVAAVAALMAVWWMTEAIPISATALLPLALFPLVTGGSIGIGRAAAPYAQDAIFLFMGGFMLALALEKWDLHRRIALAIVGFFGTGPDRLIAGFITATAFISLWVNNTSTVVMMLPVAISIIGLQRRELVNSGLILPDEVAARTRNFALCMLLGIGYASSIGGFATPVGTAPNALLLGFLKEQGGVQIPFAQWAMMAMPISLILLAVTWIVLTRVCYPTRLPEIPDGEGILQREREELGPTTAAQKRVFIIFVLTAATWIARPWLQQVCLGEGESLRRPLAGLSDAGIAIISALACFLMPAGVSRPAGQGRERLLGWSDMVRLPWGVLLLFGGGLSLAAAMESSGVGDAIGLAVSSLAGVPPMVLLLGACALLVFMGEFTSNTAATAAMLPVFFSVAKELSIEPTLLLIPATIACSCGFMMPAGTPPNAIVFASGEMRIADMVKAGVILDVISILVIGTLGYLLTGWIMSGTTIAASP